MAITRRNHDHARPARTHDSDPLRAMRELMGWDPFHDLGPRASNDTYVPAFDVRETRDAFVIVADLPGFRDEDVHIRVDDARLVISGTRESERISDGDTFHATERTHGSFVRAFALPEGVDGQRVHAELKHGTLTLEVPKTAASSQRRIALGARSMDNLGEQLSEASGKMKGQA